MGRIGEVDAAPLAAACRHAVVDTLCSRAGDVGRGKPPVGGKLRSGVTTGQLAAQQHRQVVVFVAEVRCEGEGVGGRHTEVLR